MGNQVLGPACQQAGNRAIRIIKKMSIKYQKQALLIANC